MTPVQEDQLEETTTSAPMEADQSHIPDTHCKVCGNEIRIMINRGTGYCGELCRKASPDA